MINSFRFKYPIYKIRSSGGIEIMGPYITENIVVREQKAPNSSRTTYYKDVNGISQEKYSKVNELYHTNQFKYI